MCRSVFQRLLQLSVLPEQQGRHQQPAEEDHGDAEGRISEARVNQVSCDCPEEHCKNKQLKALTVTATDTDTVYMILS